MCARLLITAIATSLLMGCVGGRDKFEDQSRTLSLSRPISGLAKDQKSTTAWSLMNVRSFNVTACLNEQAMQRSVGEREWFIDGPGIETQSRSTSQGCLTWTEQLDFEPSARPVYIPIERTLRSQDGQYSALAIRFALNPWSGLNGEEAAVIDPQFEEPKYMAEPTQAGASLTGMSSSGQLAITGVVHRLSAQPQLQLSLHFAPELHTLTMSGATAILPVESGHMDITAQLAYRETPTSSLRALHDEISIKNVEFKNGIVDLKGLKIRTLADTDRSKGTYHLLLRLQPRDSTAGLKSFSGDIALGDWNQLSGGYNPDTEQPRPQVIQPIEQKSATPGGGFELGQVQGTTYGPSDENVVFRRILLTMRVGISGASLGDTLEGEEFSISSVENPTQSVRRKVISGELSWEDAVVHNYYSPMKSFKREIIFTRVKTGQKIKKTVDLMPWVRFLLLVQDTDQGNASVSGKAKPLDDPSTDRRAQIRLEFPCVNTGDVRYSVERDTLDLKIGMRPFFQFTPSVRRFDEPFFGMNTFDGPGLRAGYYLLTLAVFNLDRANSQVPVAITQKIVLHLGGNLSTQMSLDTKDLSLTQLRNYVVAQINFLDPKSLRDSNGQPLEPFQAFADRAPVASGRVMSSSEVNVNFPINIFPLVLSNESCAANPSQSSVDNSALIDLANRVRKSGIDLLALADEDKKRNQNPAQADPQAWKEAGRNWGLKPVELKRAGDEQVLGYEKPISLADVQEGLECAFKANEQDPKMPARCLYDANPNPLWQLCESLGRKWFEMIDAEQTRRLGTSRMRREYVLTPMFFGHCTNDTRKVLRVRKYVHALEINNADNVPIVNGSLPLNVGLRTGFAIGTDRGTEFMHEDLNRLSLAVEAVKGKGPLSGAMQIFSARPSDPTLPPKDAVNALERFMQKFKLKPNDEVSVQLKPLIKNKDSFRWIFNYQIPYAMAGLTSSTSLTLENVTVGLEVDRSRTCYTVEPTLSEEEWEGLLVPYTVSEAPTPRFYVCFPEKRGRQMLNEQYYFVYNNPPSSGGAMLDTDRAKNRWMLTFRGQRDFGVFMLNLRPHIQSYYRDSNMAMDPINPMVDSIRESALMDKTAYPTAVSAPAPGPENYDSLTNLEGYTPKIFRWLSETFSPFEDNDAPVLNDQNAPDTRKYRSND